jgi:hypothetical protein
VKAGHNKDQGKGMEFKEVLDFIRYLVCRGTPVQKLHSAQQSEFNAAYLEGIFHHNNKDFKNA